MNEIISTIYNWFDYLYSQDWDNFLYGEGYYNYLMLIVVLVSLLMSIFIYFVPKVFFSGRLKWFLSMLVSMFVVYVLTFAVSDYWAVNSTADQLPEISYMDMLGTSLISSLLSAVVYCACTILSLFSTHNYKVPFKS